MDTLLEFTDLHTSFGDGDGEVRAVDGISFAVNKGETVALVGESGSGKSVTALSAMRLLPYPLARHPGGGIRFEGEELLQISEARMRQLRGDRMAMIFQEPLSSLNPLHSIERQISETLFLHKGLNPKQARDRVVELLDLVGLSEATSRLAALPHEFSGGQQQRVMIAMALACRPHLLIADEPTTALDVTVQAQILALMKDLQKQFGMAILFITHDLGVIARMADVVAVMYLGQVVELATAHRIFKNPLHPYTTGLMASVPRLGRGHDRLEAIKGTVPVPINLPPVCRFMGRCPQAKQGLCDQGIPPLVEVEQGHSVRCRLYDESDG